MVAATGLALAFADFSDEIFATVFLIFALGMPTVVDLSVAAFTAGLAVCFAETTFTLVFSAGFTAFAAAFSADFAVGFSIGFTTFVASGFAVLLWSRRFRLRRFRYRAAFVAGVKIAYISNIERVCARVRYRKIIYIIIT